MLGTLHHALILGFFDELEFGSFAAVCNSGCSLAPSSPSRYYSQNLKIGANYALRIPE